LKALKSISQLSALDNIFAIFKLISTFDAIILENSKA